MTYTYDRSTKRNIVQLLKFAIDHANWGDSADLAKTLGCDPDWIDSFWGEAFGDPCEDD